MRPGGGFSQKITVCRVEEGFRLLKVVEGERSGTSTLDPSSTIAFGIVTGMPFALTFDALGHFEPVGELKHYLSF
jgi:hypothetical protein